MTLNICSFVGRGRLRRWRVGMSFPKQRCVLGKALTRPAHRMSDASGYPVWPEAPKGQVFRNDRSSHGVLETVKGKVSALSTIY